MYLKHKKFTLLTDNKPVKQMLENPNASIVNERIQRMMDKIPKYVMDVQYIKGSENPADYFSRNPVQTTGEEQLIIDKQSASIEDKIRQVITDAIPPCLTLAEVSLATTNSESLQAVVKYISNKQGNSEIPFKVKPYQSILQDIVMVNGVLSVNGKIVVPPALVNGLIKHAHGGHQGISKTIALLQLHTWFPGMKALTEDFIRKCMCQIISGKSIRVPVTMTDMPIGPWYKIAIDYKNLANGNLLMVVIDLYSHYPFVFEVSSTSFVQSKKVLDNLFSMFGFVVEIMSDNGPPFFSAEFKAYCKTRAIKHHLIIPLWPNSNGIVERFMRCLNKIIELSKFESKKFNEVLLIFLLNYRATPHTTTKVSPARLFFNRDIKTSIPWLNELPSGNETNHFAELSHKYNSERIKSYADATKHVKQSHNLAENDLVRIVKKVNPFKSKPNFDPELFKIIEVRGAAIAVVSVTTGQKLVRNCFMVQLVTKAKVATVKRTQSSDEINVPKNKQLCEPFMLESAASSLVHTHYYQQVPPTPPPTPFVMIPMNLQATIPPPPIPQPPPLPPLRLQQPPAGRRTSSAIQDRVNRRSLERTVSESHTSDTEHTQALPTLRSSSRIRNKPNVMSVSKFTNSKQPYT